MGRPIYVSGGILADREYSKGTSETVLVVMHVAEGRIRTDGTFIDEFHAPRDVLCSRSLYFDGMLEGKFREAREASEKGIDVQTEAWVFQVFVGWMYYSRLCRDLSKRPRSVPDPDYRKDGSDDDGNMAGGGPTSPSTIPINSEPSYDEDSRNALSWSYIDLFQVHVFADKHEMRDLRDAVLDVVLLKVKQETPVKYGLPAISDLTWLVEDIPTTSRLRRMFVDAYTGWREVHGENARPETVISKLNGLPSEFLAECLVVTQRKAAAWQCFAEHGPDCSDHDFTPDDRLHFLQMEACRYHEHEDTEEERKTCELRWSAFKQDS